ncbi:chromate efflux transporter [Psychrosphaera sp.]|nr:chromate efflux transporter [Psychrosphaera sp.]
MKLISVFLQFFYLGLISFGGPAAHIGYFQKNFVEKLKWIEPKTFAGFIGLSQFLPGPGSSQVGFAIGHERAGILGGITAFVGFTLPSFVIMFLLSTVANKEYLSQPLFLNVIHMLKVLAVVVVADAILTMFRSFCKNGITVFIAVLTAVITTLTTGLVLQILVLFSAMAVGSIFSHVITKGFMEFNDVQSSELPSLARECRKIKLVALVVLFGLLFILPTVSSVSRELGLFSDFFYVGSLVFGGGHVVLPMLQEVTPSMNNDTFLLGYATAQAIPGPMFTFATYLGGGLFVDSVFTGALLATMAIFLPGFLLIIAFKDSWKGLAKLPRISGAMVAINAAVVGLLMSAFYKPVLTSAIYSHWDVVTALVGFWAVRYAKLPVIAVVIAYVAIGFVKAL